MTPLRIVGLAQGDPNVARTSSGAALFLFDALDRRYDVVARRNVDLSPWQRRMIAARTFHPDRERWMHRFYWDGQRALRLRSRNSGKALATVDAPFDLAVQIYGIFQTTGAPYTIYVDNTIELSRRHWPEWVPIEGEDLEGLYEWERKLYGEAEHIFAVATPMADSLRDFYGVPAERVTVVGGGANFATLPDLSGAKREPVILFVGRDWRRKGGDDLIEAFEHVRAERPEVRLQIVGTDEAPHGIDGVEVLGVVSDRAELARLYANAEVFCLPSRYEPYGFSISEAMAYGLPVVTTRVGGLHEVVTHGETGLLVEPGHSGQLAQALLQLVGQPDTLARMGAAGRRRVETHLNWDATVARMAPVLDAFGGVERAAA
jgi:glycosyltransferase involved in cell wall biosynthesis